jgi:hypothetical protein
MIAILAEVSPGNCGLSYPQGMIASLLPNPHQAVWLVRAAEFNLTSICRRN